MKKSKYHGSCSDHRYRPVFESVKSIGSVSIEQCNNCLSIVVVQKRDVDKKPQRTEVAMENSAYPEVK